ncbi:MAG: glutathione ABC transporter permease [Bacteroidia bacterium]|nr:MAG: glutathione ABC transporter permease [Bacteroidia bacterium]
MVRFFLRVALQALLLFFFSFTLLFFLVRGLGDPAQMLLGQRSDQASLEAIRASLHLDQPLWRQYLYAWRDWLPYREGQWRFPSLGVSYQFGRPVAHLFWEKLPATLLLGGLAFGVAVLLGVGGGLWQAYRPAAWREALSLVVLSLPSYVLGLLLIVLLALRLRWLPPAGYVYAYDPVAEKVLWQGKYLILPVLALALRPAAYFFQLTAAQARQILASQYVRAARARGKATWAILTQDVLRALFPSLATALSQWLASLFTGALFVEELFDWPGLGKLLFFALSTSDFPLILGLAQLSALLFVGLHTLGELLAWWSDPRLRT